MLRQPWPTSEAPTKTINLKKHHEQVVSTCSRGRGTQSGMPLTPTWFPEFQHSVGPGGSSGPVQGFRTRSPGLRSPLPVRGSTGIVCGISSTFGSALEGVEDCAGITSAPSSNASTCRLQPTLLQPTDGSFDGIICGICGICAAALRCHQQGHRAS
ncbi:hypothetical protein K402DRAFT_147002 [Aulographum hederae CBS 113979]|uniref:Uncharacterized protein n=1 Tax=Aulographum hederae CBS 113979 TaxID=1176131 RepID=A0A6G1GTH6_9PEZI|nr:hypothetical protein K402DRAFT_147002 [Aulographum hederae CBS 113979]